jgi:hypothetical protein
MAHAPLTIDPRPAAGEGNAACVAAPVTRYEPPRILRRRDLVDATLQTFSGACDPTTQNCGVGGH